MATPSKIFRKRQAAPRHAEIRTPHPSWRIAGPAGESERPVTSARDFWDRLGI